MDTTVTVVSSKVICYLSVKNSSTIHFGEREPFAPSKVLFI
ncbi:hypothetical protein [Megamonas funiformis]